MTVYGLTAGSSIMQNPNFNIPTTVPIGNYYLLAYADRLDNVIESDESNNILAATNQIKIAFKDLTVTSLSGPTTGAKGSPITITSTIKNQGTADIINNFIIRYYLSADQAFQSANDYTLGDMTINGLLAGGTTTKNPTLTIPTTIPTGNYYLLAYADKLGNILESDESNNVLASANQINISSSSFNDLTATSLSGPTTGVRGSNISISSAIINQGTANTTGNFIVRYYLSADQTFQGSLDYVLGDMTVYGLLTGGTINKNLTVTIPTTVPTGSYYILAYVDRLNNVTESDESNNVLASVARITVS